MRIHAQVKYNIGSFLAVLLLGLLGFWRNPAGNLAIVTTMNECYVEKSKPCTRWAPEVAWTDCPGRAGLFGGVSRAGYHDLNMLATLFHACGARCVVAPVDLQMAANLPLPCYKNPS